MIFRKNAIIIIILALAAIASFLWYEKTTQVVPSVMQNNPDEQKQSPDLKTPEIETTPEIEPKSTEPEITISPKLEVAPKVVLTPTPEVKQTQNLTTSGNHALTNQGVILQTNLQRKTYIGANLALAKNSLLDIAAQNKLADMFANQYFGHVSPKGLSAGDLISKTGYEYVAVGENLAMGDYESDADLVAAWMASPGHRENILKTGYKEIGVAVGYGMFNGRKTWLAVQEFGMPKSACPEVDKTLSAQIDTDKIALDVFSQSQKLLSQKIDEEKNLAQSLKNDLQKLIAANADYQLIESKQNEFNQAVNQVNADVKTYNNNLARMRQTYNDYETKINQYNSQIKSFNDCLGALK